MPITKKIARLTISLLLPLLAGAIGSYFTAPAIEAWYTGLIKPPLTPPDWLFAPAWTVLYVLMGISLFLVWSIYSEKNEEKRTSKTALTFFGTQLALNTTWSVVFFGMQNPAWAFVNIFLLWFFILFTIILFYRIRKSAAYLLMPYLLWVGFAGYLNLFIWILN